MPKPKSTVRYIESAHAHKSANEEIDDLLDEIENDTPDTIVTRNVSSNNSGGDKVAEMTVQSAVEVEVEVDSEISDSDLEAGGMTRVTAWVRGGLPSGNAQRVAKSRARAASGAGNGPQRKQLNITAPTDDDARALLKALSAAMVRGDITPDEVRHALSGLVDGI